MSVEYPTTDDTPTLVAILPDWSQSIQQATIYRTDITRSRRGLEQRAQRRRRPMLSMQYQMNVNDADARRLIETAVLMSRKPVIVPWWPHGSTVNALMTNDTAVTLASSPISDDWDQSGWVYFWSRTQGAEWRQITGREGRVLTLLDEGVHTRFAAGAYCFPGRLAVRDREEAMLGNTRHRTSIDRLIFRTL